MALLVNAYPILPSVTTYQYKQESNNSFSVYLDSSYEVSQADGKIYGDFDVYTGRDIKTV